MNVPVAVVSTGWPKGALESQITLQRVRGGGRVIRQAVAATDLVCRARIKYNHLMVMAGQVVLVLRTQWKTVQGLH